MNQVVCPTCKGRDTPHTDKYHCIHCDGEGTVVSCSNWLYLPVPVLPGHKAKLKEKSMKVNTVVSTVNKREVFLKKDILDRPGIYKVEYDYLVVLENRNYLLFRRDNEGKYISKSVSLFSPYFNGSTFREVEGELEVNLKLYH